MITEKHFMRAVVGALAVGMMAVASRVPWVRADGIPTPNPLTYSGTLMEGGAPVTGMRNIALALWDVPAIDPMATDVSHLTRCNVPSAAVAVEQGRFQIALPDACSAVIHDNRNLWVEVSVNGAPLGRTKIGAVPFAVEAERSGGLTTAAANALMPTGSVVAFAGRPDRVPAGWLLCDGRSVTRDAYPALFAAIGTAHGGDGTNFNLPDYRGRFLRGVDNGVNRDPDRGARAAANAGGATGDAVGSVQGHEFATHDHPVVDPGHSHTIRALGGSPSCTATTTLAGQPCPGGPFEVPGAGLLAQTRVTVGSRGGAETRPVNANVHYIIKQ